MSAVRKRLSIILEEMQERGWFKKDFAEFNILLFFRDVGIVLTAMTIVGKCMLILLGFLGL